MINGNKIRKASIKNIVDLLPDFALFYPKTHLKIEQTCRVLYIKKKLLQVAWCSASTLLQTHYQHLSLKQYLWNLGNLASITPLYSLLGTKPNIHQQPLMTLFCYYDSRKVEKIILTWIALFHRWEQTSVTAAKLLFDFRLMPLSRVL